MNYSPFEDPPEYHESIAGDTHMTTTTKASQTPETDALVSQRFVDRIITRAQNSMMSLGEPKNTNIKPYDLANYVHPDFESVAIMLVGAHEDKYDLVSLMCAAMEEVAEHARTLETQRDDLLSALECVHPILELIARTGQCAEGGEQTGNRLHVISAEGLVRYAIARAKGQEVRS
jgi:hypothetical protein